MSLFFQSRSSIIDVHVWTSTDISKSIQISQEGTRRSTYIETVSVGLKQTKSMSTNSIQRQVFKACAGVEKEKWFRDSEHWQIKYP